MLNEEDYKLVTTLDKFDPCVQCSYTLTCESWCSRKWEWKNFTENLRDKRIYDLWWNYNRYFILEKRIANDTKEYERIKEILMEKGLI